MNEKEREGNMWEEWIFAQNCGVALTHYHGDCLTLSDLSIFYLLCVCQNLFAVQIYINLY